MVQDGAAHVHSGEDDVDRYCPDWEIIFKLYEEADRLMQQQEPVCQEGRRAGLAQ